LDLRRWTSVSRFIEYFKTFAEIYFLLVLYIVGVLKWTLLIFLYVKFKLNWHFILLVIIFKIENWMLILIIFEGILIILGDVLMLFFFNDVQTKFGLCKAIGLFILNLLQGQLCKYYLTLASLTFRLLSWC
jgi:hypothetical protein